jgi:hypothetical protein
VYGVVVGGRRKPTCRVIDPQFCRRSLALLAVILYLMILLFKPEGLIKNHIVKESYDNTVSARF